MGKQPTYQKNSYEPQGENLDEFNISGGSIGFRIPLGRGANRTSGLTLGVKGGSRGIRTSAQGEITNTTNRVKSTDPKTAKVDDALKNYETGAPIPKPEKLPDKTGGSLDVNVSGTSAPVSKQSHKESQKDEKIDAIRARRATRMSARNRNTQLNQSYKPEGELVDEGKKDACYHKVKSRYSVWPSAYASGALVKCRKVGAKNWGNKTKKEDYDYSNWRDDFQAMDVESVDIIKAEPLQPTQGIGSDMLDEKKKLMNKLDKISGQLKKASAMHKKQSQEVAKVSQHLCAKKVCHEEYGQGDCIFGQHAVPDENGFVSHYNVQFEHGIVENVSVEDLEVLTEGVHPEHTEMEGDLISEGGKKCWKGYKKKEPKNCLVRPITVA